MNDGPDPSVFLATVAGQPTPAPAPEPAPAQPIVFQDAGSFAARADIAANVQAQRAAAKTDPVEVTTAEEQAAIEGMSLAQAAALLVDASGRLEAAHAALGDAHMALGEAMHDTWKAQLALAKSLKRAQTAIGVA